MSDDDKPEPLTADDLDEWQRLYEYTGNPLLLWDAYAACRKSATPLPDWICVAFDKIAENIELADPELAEHRWVRSRVGAPLKKVAPVPGAWQKRLLGVFGFRNEDARGGPNEPFKALSRALEAISAATRVRVLIDHDELNVTNAYYLVADRLGESEVWVRRAWKDHEAFVRSLDLHRLRQKVLDADAEAEAERGRRRRIRQETFLILRVSVTYMVCDSRKRVEFLTVTNHRGF